MNKSKKIIPIFVPHRGCPNDCVFCNQKKITGQTYNNIDKNYVIKVVEEYLSTRPKYDDLAYFGGSFTAIDIDTQIELLEIAHFYQKKGVIENIRISTRPDAISEEILEIQKKYGVTIIELGIQSLDNDVLIKSNRGHTVEDSIKAGKLIKKYGFILGHQIMPGLPGSSIEKDINTCLESIKQKPDIVRIYPTLVIKETALENMYKENRYKPLSVETAVNLCAYIYSLYTSNDITVIRIGLQNTDTINELNDVVAGPFHPSFRQLVEESLYYDTVLNGVKKHFKNIFENMHDIDENNDITICAGKKLMTYIVGHKKRNIEMLKKNLPIRRIYLKETSDNENFSVIDSKENTFEFNKNDIYKEYVLNYKTEEKICF